MLKSQLIVSMPEINANDLCFSAVAKPRGMARTIDGWSATLTSSALSGGIRQVEPSGNDRNLATLDPPPQLVDVEFVQNKTSSSCGGPKVVGIPGGLSMDICPRKCRSPTMKSGPNSPRTH